MFKLVPPSWRGSRHSFDQTGVLIRILRGFREVFARFSLQKYFRERFARAEQKNQFLRAAGAPARGAAEPGPPRHAKIGKNHLNQSVRPMDQATLCLILLFWRAGSGKAADSMVLRPCHALPHCQLNQRRTVFPHSLFVKTTQNLMICH